MGKPQYPGHFYTRNFLNSERGTAFLEIEGVMDAADGKRTPFVSAQVKVADCNRVATLDFDIYRGDSEYDDETWAARLDKLDVLINELKEFRKWFIKAGRYQEANRVGKNDD